MAHSGSSSVKRISALRVRVFLRGSPERNAFPSFSIVDRLSRLEADFGWQYQPRERYSHGREARRTSELLFDTDQTYRNELSKVFEKQHPRADRAWLKSRPQNWDWKTLPGLTRKACERPSLLCEMCSAETSPKFNCTGSRSILGTSGRNSLHSRGALRRGSN